MNIRQTKCPIGTHKKRARAVAQTKIFVEGNCLIMLVIFLCRHWMALEFPSFEHSPSSQSSHPEIDPSLILFYSFPILCSFFRSQATRFRASLCHTSSLPPAPPRWRVGHGTTWRWSMASFTAGDGIPTDSWGGVRTAPCGFRRAVSGLSGAPSLSSRC